MRLVCPKCASKYEVPDDAIPKAGRDVQCGNCGHGWFQTNEGSVPAAKSPVVSAAVAAAAEAKTRRANQAAEAVKAADESVKPPAPNALAPVVDPVADAALAAALADPPPPRVDEKVLAILREEAEREAKARRGEPLPPEGPTERGVAPTPSPVHAEKPSVAAPAVDDSLPNVDAINSTLRSETDSKAKQRTKNRTHREGGFLPGFLSVVAVAVVAVGVYVYAGPLSDMVPALADPLADYVAVVNDLRTSVDNIIRSVASIIADDAA